MVKKRYLQNDVLKGVAIWMVLVNHSYNYVYSSELLFKMSRSCVQVFLFCAGVNACLKFRTLFIKNFSSEEKVTSLIWKCFFRPRFISICVPYVVFTASFYFLWKRQFNLFDIWRYVVGFNIANPVYFIPIYLQLILCAPFIYYLISLRRFPSAFWNFTLGFISLIICIWFGKSTYMFPIYASGQYFLGATYGWTFILGMMFGNTLALKDRNIVNPYVGFHSLLSAGILIVWIISLSLFPDIHKRLEYLFKNIGGNPPGLDSLIEGFLIIYIIWTTVTCLEYKFSSSKIFTALIQPLVLCGKNSFYIFLWHMFVKAMWNQIITASNFPKQSILYAIPFYFGSTFVVIMMKKLWDRIKKSMETTFLRNDMNEQVL